MASIAPPIIAPTRGSLLSRMPRTLSPEGANLLLFVGLAIGLAIAALAVGTLPTPIDLEQATRMAP